MNICLNTGKPNSYCYITAADRLCRCYFCKLNFLLRLRHLKQSPLPFVVGLLTDTVLPAPGFDLLAAVTALRDSPGLEGQFVLSVVSVNSSHVFQVASIASPYTV